MLLYYVVLYYSISYYTVFEYTIVATIYYSYHNVRRLWLRTNGVNTNGAAAEVMDFDRLGKKVRPGASGKIKVG